MPRNCLSLLKFSVAIAAILAVQRCVPRTYGSDTIVPAVPSSSVRTPASNQGVESLRREVYDLTRLLQAQQEQMNRQSARLQEFQQEMNRQAEEIQRMPPVDTRTPATTISNTTEFVEPGGACGECAPPCGPCDPCDSYGSCNGCGCDPLWWDIGGQYRVMFNHSNFRWHAEPDGTISDNQPTQTFFNQRFRTWLEVHPNDNVEGYIQMEVGHIGWGTNWDFPKTYNGPRWPGVPAGDRVGIEMRRGWLQYQNMNVGRLRAGIQGWQDSFGQVLASSDWDFSVGGLSWARTFPAFGDTDMLFGIFALNEGNAQFADDAILVTLDLDRALSEKTSVGASAYYLLDNGGSAPNWGYSYPVPPFAPYLTAWDAWFGVRGKTQVGRIPINAFFIYNPGQRTNLAAPTFVHEGIAFKLAAGPVPVGPGKCSVQAMYSTGNRNQQGSFSNEFRTVAQSGRDNFGAEGYWSYLVITSAYGPADVNDLGVSLQNRGFGLITIQGKYEFPISRRLSGEFAAGWLRSDTVNWNNGGRELGTELAQKFSFDFGGGLIADFGFAYLFTGDFYRAGPAAAHPDNLWEAYTRAQLEF